MSNVTEIEKIEDEHEKNLTEVYGEVEICGMVFDSGTALKELDPTAFKCSMADASTEYKCDECDTIYNDMIRLKRAVFTLAKIAAMNTPPKKKRKCVAHNN